jgi:hypothetical protein
MGGVVYSPTTERYTEAHANIYEKETKTGKRDIAIIQVGLAIFGWRVDEGTVRT